MSFGQEVRSLNAVPEENDYPLPEKSNFKTADIVHNFITRNGYIMVILPVFSI